MQSASEELAAHNDSASSRPGSDGIACDSPRHSRDPCNAGTHGGYAGAHRGYARADSCASSGDQRKAGGHSRDAGHVACDIACGRAADASSCDIQSHVRRHGRAAGADPGNDPWHARAEPINHGAGAGPADVRRNEH